MTRTPKEYTLPLNGWLLTTLIDGADKMDIHDIIDRDNAVTIEQLQRIAPYSTLDVCKILGIKRERLRDWLKTEQIEPTVPALKQGVKAGFSKADIYAIELFKRQIDKGLKREFIADLIHGYTGVLNSSHEHSPYIVWLVKMKNGERIIDHMTFLQGDAKVTLSIDKDSFDVVNTFKPPGGGEWITFDEEEHEEQKKEEEKDIWQEIIIVNMVELRAYVDARIKAF